MFSNEVEKIVKESNLKRKLLLGKIMLEIILTKTKKLFPLEVTIHE